MTQAPNTLAGLMQQIYQARQWGYSDEEILGYLCIQNVQGLRPHLLELRRAGYGATAILQYLEMSMVLVPMANNTITQNQPPEVIPQSKWIN